MGRKLDALLGRNFKATKLKTLTKLAISRSAIMKNQRQARCQQAKSDVLELLKLGHNERALLRVELVIKDQNMVDAFDLIEEYCLLLSERVVLLQKNKECPEELQEAVSSLIFASSRCGEFPELQGIRGIFASRFGKEFADRAIELRNNCGVSPKIIQKLSARQPSMESKLNALKQIASNNGIIFWLEEETPVVAEEKRVVTQNEKQIESDKSANLSDTPRVALREETNNEETLSESLKLRKKKYKDVASAALDAFESAAYAAAAARAAVQLSKSESHDNDQNHSNGSDHFYYWKMGHNRHGFAALEEDDMNHQKHISSKYPPVEVPDRERPNQEEEEYNWRLPFHSPKWGSEDKDEPEADVGKRVNLQHLRLDTKPVPVRTRKVGGK